MDLLSTIRKSGSRGGVNFSWDDVAKSSRRENYLGHSLKAPVGRWQTGKDLNWYSKSDDPTAEDAKEQLRKDELRKIKEAEEDAIARALGLPPPVRESSGANAIEVKPRDRDIHGQGTKEDEVDSNGNIKKARSDGRRDHRRDDRSNRRHYHNSRHHDDAHEHQTNKSHNSQSRHHRDSRDRHEHRSRRYRSRSRSAERSTRKHHHRSHSRDRHASDGNRSGHSHDSRPQSGRDRSPGAERLKHGRYSSKH
ncbi:hypothetical protein Cpir12675_000393 [Ceratocystis pirilliformis]|uniref:Multiple myeloma tumor-associated protein 2-like N-terminal domain-containing protein n=1 Tax=Ceratocystis pirilliformis TaxID=259994 RepID=A0ABR3ZN50_9PEZI